MDTQDGWAALRDADWTAAHDAFAVRLEAEPEDPEALDGLGRALWWIGDPREGMERRREAYVLYRRRGDARAAANRRGHVGRILGKLGLRSRAEAASYVLRGRG
jgi:hypothetical protein